MNNANPTWLDGFFTPSTSGDSGPITQGDTTRTEVADVYQNFFIQYVGSLGGDRTVLLPIPSNGLPTAYVRCVFNNTTGGHNLIISTGIGTTIPIGSGKTAFIQVSIGGVRRLSADV